MERTGYDVIGDVHGHAAKLVDLLHTLGYRQRRGAWRHSHRLAVFVGDLIDRGPQQLETVRLVREMVDAGTARIVLGNHEFNAVAFATRDPDSPDEFLRPRRGEVGRKNCGQHAAFLAAVGDGSPLHAELIDWFLTLPVWLDLSGLRTVHACWDPDSMEVLGPLLGPSGELTGEAVVRGSRRGTPEYRAIETLVKGPEIALPEDYVYLDKDGHARNRARLSWWDRDATTLRRAAEIPASATRPDGGPLPPLPDEPVDEADLLRYTDDVPVVYGHYWRTGPPAIIGSTTACVDYSAGKGGPLVAYRWSGEATLDDAKFVAVG